MVKYHHVESSARLKAIKVESSIRLKIIKERVIKSRQVENSARLNLVISHPIEILVRLKVESSAWLLVGSPVRLKVIK